MSLTATRTVIEYLESPGCTLTPAARFVLITLADFHNDKTQQCNPSAARIAKRTGFARSTVVEAITQLVDRRAILRTSGGGRVSNRYLIDCAHLTDYRTPAHRQSVTSHPGNGQHLSDRGPLSTPPVGHESISDPIKKPQSPPLPVDDWRRLLAEHAGDRYALAKDDTDAET